MKVIIVEDEGITSLFLSKAVRSLGHEVVEIFDRGDTLLAYLETDEADLVFMDININGSQDGIQVVSILKKKYPNISCIFITSYADKESMEEACALKPLGYLHKPIDLSDIETILILAEAHRSVLPQTNKIASHTTIGAYQHDFANHTLYLNDTLIKLSKQEHLCLHFFLSHRHAHVSKQQLILYIWGDDKEHDSSLRELLSRLRKKMPDIEIVNIPNVGYLIQERT